MLDQVRLFRELDGAKRVLLAGAGGGFDLYAAVPLYIALRRRGCEVFLGNLSFTNLVESDATRLTEACVEVTAETRGPDDYFPERSLARFLRGQEMETRIFAFERAGVEPVFDAYAHLKESLRLDTVVLVDGGTDLLMRGDEEGLGTPVEDMTSLAAGRRLDLARAACCCIGFGVDRFHGVRHTQFLENVAALSRVDGFWGSISLTPDMAEAQTYLAAVDHAATETSRRSIVNGSIADSVAGRYGDVHRYPARTAGSTLWINPLMAILWSFDLQAVAAANLYLARLDGTRQASDVQVRILEARYDLERRAGPLDIPV